jgi:precorrin-6A/cobalt-precorrin-6A reductase
MNDKVRLQAKVHKISSSSAYTLGRETSMRVLVLGGTSEAMKLAHLLSKRSGLSSMLSLAGRTKEPSTPPIPFRIGGFGGVDGLQAFLESERIDVLVDATHPFAEQISRNAAIAAARVNIPLAILTRPAWAPEAGDHWIVAVNMAEAAAALGREPKRVFLTIGRLQIESFASAPHHFYLIRTIEPLTHEPNLPRYRIIHARGPFSAAAEEELLRKEAIDVIVTKNSGGEAIFAKILAARRLGLPVVMVARPRCDSQVIFHNPQDVMDFILRHREAFPRGV